MASLLPALHNAAAGTLTRRVNPTPAPAAPKTFASKAAMVAVKADAQRAKATAKTAARVLRKELRAEKQAIKRKLVANEMAGLFDFVSQGFSVVKDLAPAALKANIEKKIATTQAKAAERVAAANERAAASAVSVNTLQPTPAQPVPAAMDWKKPAMIAGGIAVAALVLPRLLPARSAA